jgi:hypothetical protein
MGLFFINVHANAIVEVVGDGVEVDVLWALGRAVDWSCSNF